MIINPTNNKRIAIIKDSNEKEVKKTYDKNGNLIFKNWNTL